MSFEDAEQALGEAIEQDAADEVGGSEQIPAQQAQPESTPTVVDAPGAAPAAEPADTFDSGAFNPDTLPPELQPAWKQLQAAYTQKTQSLAERQRQFEDLGDPDTLLASRELYERLQDPNSWQALHGELSTALEAMGLSPAQAQAEVAQAISAEQQQGGSSIPGLSALEADPELQPLAQYIRDMETRQVELDARLQERDDNERTYQYQQALLGEMQRQEGIIRQSNSGYDQGDIDMVYETSSFYDGNLLRAQQRLEEYVNARVQRYVGQKTAVSSQPELQSLPGGAALSRQIQETPGDLDDVHEAVLKNLEGQGIEDFDFGA